MGITPKCPKCGTEEKHFEAVSSITAEDKLTFLCCPCGAIAASIDNALHGKIEAIMEKLGIDYSPPRLGDI